MARRMVRDRAGHGIGAAYVWYLGHARKRFGASGWRIAQAAGHAVFDRRTVAYAASGSVADHMPDTCWATGSHSRFQVGSVSSIQSLGVHASVLLAPAGSVVMHVAVGKTGGLPQ